MLLLKCVGLDDRLGLCDGWTRVDHGINEVLQRWQHDEEGVQQDVVDG